MSALEILAQHKENIAELAKNKKPGSHYRLHVQVVEATGLKGADANGLSDPYVKFKVDGAVEAKHKTPILHETLNPVYNTVFTFNLKDYKKNGEVLVEVLDYDAANRNDSLGFCVVPLSDIDQLGYISGWFSFFKKKNCEKRTSGQLFFRAVLDYNNGNLPMDTDAFSEVRTRLLQLVAQAEHEMNDNVESLLLTKNAPNVQGTVEPARDPAVTNIMTAPQEGPIYTGKYKPVTLADVPPVTHVRLDEGAGETNKEQEQEQKQKHDSITLPYTLTPTSKCLLYSAFAPSYLPPVLRNDKLAYKVTLGCCTWNVGNAPPSSPALLSAWLPNTDIVIVGTQENQYAPRKGFKNHETDFVTTVHAALGDTYRYVSGENVGQIFVHVFAKVQVLNLLDLKDTVKASEATGIANVGTNKGGCIVSFSLFGTSFSFISAHLAAHTPFVERRNEDVSEILSGIRLKEQSAAVSVMQMTDHTFFMGDLNYRLLHAGDAKEPDQEKFQEMLQMIEEDKYDELLAQDQLHMQMKENKVFVDFTDAVPYCKPTFKVLRDEVGPKYTEKRTPSYCDRVLWHSLPGVKSDLVFEKICGVPAVISSDHKPIVAHFTAYIPVPEPAFGGEPLEYADILLFNVSAQNLPSADMNGYSDPFFKISNQYINKGNSINSSVCNKTLNPVWNDDTLRLRLDITNTRKLRRFSLPLTIWDKDLTNATALASTVIPFHFRDLHECIANAETGVDQTTNVYTFTNVALKTKGNNLAGTCDFKYSIQFKKSNLTTTEQLFSYYK